MSTDIFESIGMIHYWGLTPAINFVENNDFGFY